MHSMYIHTSIEFENQLGGTARGKMHIQSIIKRPANPLLGSRTWQVQWNPQVLCYNFDVLCYNFDVLELYHCFAIQLIARVTGPSFIAVINACKTEQGAVWCGTPPPKVRTLMFSGHCLSFPLNSGHWRFIAIYSFSFFLALAWAFFFSGGSRGVSLKPPFGLLCTLGLYSLHIIMTCGNPLCLLIWYKKASSSLPTSVLSEFWSTSCATDCTEHAILDWKWAWLQKNRALCVCSFL